MTLHFERLPIPGIHVWRISLRFPFSLHAYAVIDEDGRAFLADTLIHGAARRLWEKLDGHPAIPRPEKIVLTHCHGDHAGGALMLSTAWNAEVLCGENELPFVRGERRLWEAAAVPWRRLVLKYSAWGGLVEGLPVLWAKPLREGQELGQWRILTIPGHTPGQIALWHEASRTLICGDGFFNFFNCLSADPFPGVSLDPEAERQSMRRMAGLSPDNLLPAHGPALLGDASLRLARFKADMRSAKANE